MAYKGAIAATFVCLAPEEDLDPTMRYGAQCSITGREYVGAAHLDGWPAGAPGVPLQDADNEVTRLATDLVHRYDAALAPVLDGSAAKMLA